MCGTMLLSISVASLSEIKLKESSHLSTHFASSCGSTIEVYRNNTGEVEYFLMDGEDKFRVDAENDREAIEYLERVCKNSKTLIKR